MIVILRGHIRDSFATDDLLQLVLSMGPDLDLYIHTWSVYSNGVSWREIPTNLEKVTEESIRAYFQDVPIRHIQIDDDTDLPLVGTLEGTIWGGPMPLLGWKRYWYNQYAAIEYVHQLGTYSDETTVLNLRFDVLNNSNHEHYPLDQIHAFVDRYRNQTLTKNRFIRDQEWWGIDNMYIGSLFTMRFLIRAFHYHLDDIVKQNEGAVHSEYLVYRVNEKLFPPPFRLSSIENIAKFFHK